MHEEPITLFDLAGALLQADFDVEAYVALHPDLQLLQDDVCLIAEHLIAYGLAEGRALIFRTIDGFLQFLRRSAEADEAIRRQIWDCVLNGWYAWQAQAHAQDSSNWPRYAELGDAFRFCGFQPVCVIGDSHSYTFAGAAMRRLGVACLWALCSGGSARGLVNPNSVSGYGKAIQERLRTGDHPTIFHFGQVDAEFVYYYQVAVRQDGPASLDALRAFIVESCDRYFDFIASTTHANIAISAIFPPCLRDDYIHQGSVNAHIAFLNADMDLDDLRQKLNQVDFPDLRARTAMHYLMNLELARRAGEAGLGFINAWSAMVDERGLISDRMNSSGGSDHHTDLQATAEVLAPHVLETFERFQAQDLSARLERQLFDPTQDDVSVER